MGAREAAAVTDRAADASPPGGGPPGFLVIGHAVQDLLPDGDPPAWRLGGAVAYASCLAVKLGLDTAVLTSAGPDIDLASAFPGVDVANVPSKTSTRFRNVYGKDRRQQYLPSRAAPITPDDLPAPWRQAQIVLLGPVADEVDPALAGCFPGALVGVGAQGWLRETGPDTAVRALPPEEWDDQPILRFATALFLSNEDIPPEASATALQHWGEMVPTVAFTRGYDGTDIVHGGDRRHIDAFPATAVDPTGAGDVFASAFLIRFKECGDVWDAARFAACAASFAVEGEGTATIPDRHQIEERLRRNPDIIAR